MNQPKMNQSALKAIRVLEYLFEHGLEGATMLEISRATNLAQTTTWRLLHTLKSQGWVFDVPAGDVQRTDPGGNARQSTWRVGLKPTRLAFSFKRHTLARIQGTEAEYLTCTGESVRNDD